MEMLAPYLWYVATAVGVLALLGIGWVVVKVGVKKALTGVGWFWTILLVVYPFILFGWGAAMPSLQATVEGFALPGSVKDGAMLIGGVGVVFITVETLAAQFATRAFTLVTDLATNVLWGLGFAMFVGIELGRGTLQYYELFSASVAIVAALTGSVAYVIGAWNKNPTQVARGNLS